MRQPRIIIILLLLVSTILVSCTNDTKNSDSYNQENSVADFTEIAETENKEVDNVKREFCKVESLQKDNFTLKNTADEIYYIDNSFLGDFKVGDNVLLLYFDRASLGDGEYAADVYAIYSDDDSLLSPAN